MIIKMMSYQKSNISYLYDIESKAGPDTFTRFKNDDFWLSTQIDSITNGSSDEVIWTTYNFQKKQPYNLEDIICPVSVWIGDGDQSISVESCKWINSLCKDTKLEILSSCGHMCIISPTNQFQNMVLSLL